MKKIITNFILFLIFILIFFISILATIGIETNKFNKYISNATIKTKKNWFRIKYNKIQT